MNFQANFVKRRPLLPGNLNLEAPVDREDDDDDLATQTSSISSNSIATHNEKPLLVIPLQSSFRGRGGTKAGGDKDDGTYNSLDAQAAKEILEQASSTVSSSSSSGAVFSAVISLPNSSSDSLDEDSSGGRRRRPLLLSNIPSELLGAMDDEERFRKDLSLRADDVLFTSRVYEEIPISEFGAAMLRGMGWVGSKEEAERFDKKYSEPIVARESRVGLGATARPPDKNSRGSKEKKEKDTQQWAQKADEKLRTQQIGEGQIIWIRDPLYAGRRAVIVATHGVPGLDRIRVSMESDGTMVEIKRTDAVLLGEAELIEQPYAGTIPKLEAAADASQPRECNGGRAAMPSNIDDKKRREAIGTKAEPEKKRRKGDGETRSCSSSNWLRPGIRVRVVSKKVGGAYLQKAGVLDVYQAGTCSLQFDDGSVLEGVKQKHLETVLPSVGVTCMILSGEHEGQTAQLLEKRKESEQAVVQLSSELDVVVVSMDIIAALS